MTEPTGTMAAAGAPPERLLTTFRFLPPAIAHEQSVDFYAEDDILLHIKVRPALNEDGARCILVANDRRGEGWGKELRLPITTLDEAGTVEVMVLQGEAGIVLEAAGHGRLPVERLPSLRPASRVEHSSNVLALRPQGRDAPEAAPAAQAAPGPQAPPPIQGALDEVSERLVAGWAFDPRNPERPVSLDLLVDGRLAARFAADKPRADLRESGLGAGNCGFFVPTPAALLDGQPHQLRLLVTNLDLELAQSPRGVSLARLPAPAPAVPEAAATPSPAGAAMQLAALLRREAGPLLALAFDGLLPPALPAAPPPPACLRDDFAGVPLAVQDLWFDGEATLRLRLGSAPAGPQAEPPPTLRALQPELGGTALRVVAERALDASGLTLLDLPLPSPYAPVLIVAYAGDGTVLGTTLLPFPSLCRGGAHGAELAMLGARPNMLANLRVLSDALLAEALGGVAAPTIGRIEVAIGEAGGNERIFSPEFLAWLGAVAQLRAVPTPGEETPPSRRHLEEALRAAPPAAAARAIELREARGAAALRLPADALPTLSAVLSRRLPVPQEGTALTGAHAVADAATALPGWSVSFPPVDAALAELQPRHLHAPLPCLVAAASLRRGAVAPVTGRAEVPLAIRFLPPPTARDAPRLRPVAEDAPGPLLRRALSAAEREEASVTLLLSDALPAADAVLMLESCALQTLAPALEVVAQVDAAGLPPPVAEALERLFPGRHRLVAGPAGGPSARLNRLAAEARGRYLLLAEEAAVLHDPRTLEAMATLLLDRRAATAAPTLVREEYARRRWSFGAATGGLFPSHLSLLSMPRLVVAEPASRQALPGATYPVLGNSFRLVLVRAATWHGLGGLDAASFPGQHADLDFALRALADGQRHLCTSAVAAVTRGMPEEREDADPIGAAFLPMPAWEEILGSVTLLRALR